jgi:uncharacterized membrane protein
VASPAVLAASPAALVAAVAVVVVVVVVVAAAVFRAEFLPLIWAPRHTGRGFPLFL